MRENCTSGLMSEEEKRSEFQHATALLLDSTIDRKLKSIDVIDVLSDLFILRGVPEHILY
jgi:hypothetical protein